MNLKKLFLMLAASAALLVSGCGGDSPESVADGYLQALLDGDVNKATALSTARSAPTTAFLSAMAQEQKNKHPDQVKKPTFKSVTVDGDKAVVYYEDNGRIDLVRENGDWKVDIKKN